MVEKGIKGRIFSQYMKDYDKNKEFSCLQYWDVNDFQDGTVLQKLPVNNFDWIKDTSQFNKDFIKTIMKKMIKNIFLKLVFNILKRYINFIVNED